MNFCFHKRTRRRKERDKGTSILCRNMSCIGDFGIPSQKKGGQATSTQLAISSAQKKGKKKGDRHCLLSLQLAVPEKCLSPFLLLPACLALFTLPRNKRAVRATNCSITQKARIIIAMLPGTGLPSPAGLSHQTNDLHGHLDQQCWLHLSNTEPSHSV